MNNRTSGWLLRAAFVMIGLFAVNPALSEDLPDGMVSVRYIFQIGEGNAIGGQAFCHIGRDCQLNFSSDLVQLTLRLGETVSGDTLTVECHKLETNCYLQEGRLLSPQLRSRGFSTFRIVERLPMGDLMIRAARGLGVVNLLIQSHRPISGNFAPRRNI